ncbi:MAG TPA: trehalase family glycosidase [Rariglobus sp.]|nr:trehalase family glycosidase [Rariglobus sp.]
MKKSPRWIAAVSLLSFAALLPVHAAPAASPDLRIGNFFPSAPAGIAFIKDNAAAFLLNVGVRGEFIYGLAAPDDSIHVATFKNSPLKLEWGRVGDAIVAKLSATAPTEAYLQLTPETWPGFPVPAYAAMPDGAKGTAMTAKGALSWSLRLSPNVAHGDLAKMTTPVTPAQPVYFTAGMDPLPAFTPAQIDGLLQKAAASYEARTPQAGGAWGDFLGAIADNLNNTRLYASDNHKVAHTVTRAWVPKNEPNASPYFCWDSFFNGLLSCIDDPVAARDTVRAVLAGAQPDGFVPNFSHWNTGRKVVSANRSQPPVGAMCVWKMHQHRPDLNFLREVYPKLAAWHAWWFTARDGNHDGLLEWGGDIPLFECGWDDSPQFTGTKKIGNTLNADAVDLNSLYTADAQYLAKIADVLGLTKEAQAYREESTTMIKRINDRLWNEELGVYCSRFWDADGKPGAFLTRITPMNFYPLIAGAADEARGRRVLALMTDPKKFWGEWILPTVAYDDPFYPQQAYWRGKVWAPVNYLVFQGLKRYGSPEQIAHFGERSVELFMRNWNQDRVCGENYLSTTGEQQAQRSDPHYTWGALLCMVGLESLVDIDEQGRFQMAKGASQNIELHNIPFAGRVINVSFQNGRGVLR